MFCFLLTRKGGFCKSQKGHNMTNNYAVCYCRISTDKAEQKLSLEHQRTLFLDTIKKNGETLFDIYVDEGETGTMLDNREGFERMLYDAGIDIHKHTYDGTTITNFVASKRTPKFQKIYIKNTSRFARNTLSKQIINELRKKNVSIFFLEQNINTSGDNSLMLDLHQIFDENESRDKSKKIITALHQSAENNVVKTNKSIYGYRYYPVVKDDRNTYYSNRLIAIPEEAEVVKLIFELYLNGKGIRAIAKELAKREIKTRQGGYFSKSTIGNILDNEKYCGLNQHFKWSAGYVFERHSIRKNESYSTKECDRIEPIINVEIFNKCKAIRRGNTENKRGRTTKASMFSKRIKCYECGANYNVDTYDGVKVYRCPTRKFQSLEACSNHYVSEKACIEFATAETTKKAVVDYILNKIQNMQQHIKDNQFLLSMLNDRDNLKALEMAQKLSIQDEIDKETRKLAQVFTRLRTREISQSEHDILASSITNRIKELNEQKENIQNNNFSTMQEMEQEEFEIDILKAAITKIKKNKEYITQHIHMLIEDGNIHLNMNNTIESIIHDAYN